MPLSQSPSYLPPPRNRKPQKIPAQPPANPRQSPPRLNTLASPHTTPASPQHQLALSPLLRRRESHAPPSHTPPHAQLSHRHAHPTPAAPASPARRLVLCRGLLLPRPCHGTHAALTCLRWPRSRCLVRASCRRGSPRRICPHPAT
jgi:hypothetical protein